MLRGLSVLNALYITNKYSIRFDVCNTHIDGIHNVCRKWKDTHMNTTKQAPYNIENVKVFFLYLRYVERCRTDSA